MEVGFFTKDCKTFNDFSGFVVDALFLVLDDL